MPFFPNPARKRSSLSAELRAPLHPRSAKPFSGAFRTCPLQVQPKLAVGEPDDEYEREADRAAEWVMRMPAEGALQRRCAACEADDELLQPKALSGNSSTTSEKHEAPSMVKEVLRSPGRPLDPRTRASMETRLGHDFGRVRVHDDARAARSAAAVNALAFTVGRHVAFAAGRYSPDSQAGRRLIAHELAHVVQQGAGGFPVTKTGVGRPDGTWNFETDRTSGAAGPDKAPQTAGGRRRAVPTSSPLAEPCLQRRLRVQNPSAPAAYLPAPDNTRPRAELVEGWLRRLCPTGSWTINRSNGELSAPDRDSVCGTGGTAASSSTPVSCNCLCRISDPAYRLIDLLVQERYAYDYFRYDPTAGIYRLHSDTAEMSREGEGATLFPEKNVWVNNATVVMSGRSTTVAGRGDTSRRGRRTISDPPWVIFAHEVCGHVGVQTAKDEEEYFHVETPSGDRSAVDIENRIRREHSTVTSSLGVRSGDTGGILGGIYAIAAGETFASVSRRLGMPTGSSAFNADGEHRRIMHWPSGDRIRRQDMASLFTAGTEIFVEGIHWHEVIAGETWSSISRMWGVPVASLRRANPGVTPATGARVLIPVR
jgi:hypothetical protein